MSSDRDHREPESLKNRMDFTLWKRLARFLGPHRRDAILLHRQRGRHLRRLRGLRGRRLGRL